jgi:putative ATPase
MGPRVLAACEVAKKLGFPEARIPLAEVVVELALSPKSNSAYEAFAKALEDYQTTDTGDIPPHILNREIGHNGVEYKYPHDYPDSWVDQEYMPKNLIGHKYYTGKETGAYERQLKGRNEELQKRKKQRK